MGHGLESTGARSGRALRWCAPVFGPPTRGLRSAAIGAMATLLLAPLVALSAPASGATKSSTPIVVGGDSSLALNPGLSQGFQAGIYRFNKSGGLDGRKIDYVGTLDDGFSPSVSLTNAQQLVEKDHVMVVAPTDTEASSAATGTFLAQQKIPFIGYAAGAPFVAAPKWGWGVNGFLVAGNIQQFGWNGISALAGHAKSPKDVKIALIGVDLPTAVTGVKELAADAKLNGQTVVYTGNPIPVEGVTNYQPFVQLLVASGANTVYTALGTSQTIGLAAALKQVDWKGFLVSAETYLPGALSQSPSEAEALDGTYVQQGFPSNQDNTPAARQEVKDLEAIGQPPYLQVGTSVGYWSAIVLEQMLRATLKKVGGNPNLVTSATLAKTVNGGFTYTDPIKGGIGTEYFPAEESVPTGCQEFLKTVGTSYKIVVPYNCQPVVNVFTGAIISDKTGKPTGKKA
jgi:ABC-type branched-subunit amino acid transport system substrate-binding protein